MRPFSRCTVGFDCEVRIRQYLRPCTIDYRWTRLCGDAEQVGDEECLTKRIVVGQPSHSSFPNHMDCFDALQGAPCTLKRTIALGEPDSFLHQAVILLDHIIQGSIAKF